MKIKLNLDLKGFKKGTILNLKEKGGIVLEQYWRNRIRDSRFDNCITIINEIEKKEKKKEKKSKEKKEGVNYE